VGFVLAGVFYYLREHLYDERRTLGYGIDVARYLGVVQDTVYLWRERLPAHKIGRLWKFQFSEVDEWVRAEGAAEDNSARSRLPLGQHLDSFL